jgi:hypothetical protein
MNSNDDHDYDEDDDDDDDNNNNNNVFLACLNSEKLKCKKTDS